jgi:uridine kinase
VKTTHWRLLRRMTRDYLFRGHTAEKTLGMWDRVREGEVGRLARRETEQDIGFVIAAMKVTI